MQMACRVETYDDNCMQLYGNLTLHAKLWNIFGFVGPIFTEKFFSTIAPTQEPDVQVWQTVEFAGKLFRTRKSQKHRDRCLTPIGHKNIFLCSIRD